MPTTDHVPLASYTKNETCTPRITRYDTIRTPGALQGNNFLHVSFCNSKEARSQASWNAACYNLQLKRNGDDKNAVEVLSGNRGF